MSVYNVTLFRNLSEIHPIAGFVFQSSKPSPQGKEMRQGTATTFSRLIDLRDRFNHFRQIFEVYTCSRLSGQIDVQNSVICNLTEEPLIVYECFNVSVWPCRNG